MPRNWCFWSVVLEKTLESPLDCKEIRTVHPRGNQFWVFIGRTDAEIEALILWPPDAKSQFMGKDPDAGKNRAREGAKRGWDVRMASLTQWTWILSKLREIAKDRKVWCVAVHGVTKSQTQLSEWTTTTAFKGSDLSLGRVCTSTDSTAVIGPLRCLLAGAFLFPILNPDAQQIPTLVTGPPSPVKCVVV